MDSVKKRDSRQVWKDITVGQPYSRSGEQPSRIEQENYPNSNKREITNFKVHKKLHKK